MREKLAGNLLRNGYQHLPSNLEEVNIYYRYQAETLEAVLVLDLHQNDSQVLYRVEEMISAVKRNFREKGYSNTEVFTLLLSEDSSQARKMTMGMQNFWIVDMTERRILIYEDQPADFYGLYDLVLGVLENRYSRKQVSGEYKNHIRGMIGCLILVIINVGIFLWSEYAGSQEIFFLGASEAYLVVEGKQYYRLFTCMFLHSGLDHIFNNMIILVALGQRLERLIGTARFLIVYILGGLGGSMFSVLYALYSGKHYMSVGASGAVFAISGGLLMVVLANRGRADGITGRSMLLMICLTLYHGFTNAGIDNAAHVGGLVSGFFISAILMAFTVYGKKKM